MTEEKESELEDFIEYSKMVLGVLGYKVFVPIVDAKKQESSDEKCEERKLELFLSWKSRKSNRRIEAKCKRTDEGFVVLKDSMIEENDSPTIPRSIKELRDTCRRNNEIIDGRLCKNYLFNSPSYGATFVLGVSVNGRAAWKTEDGRTLKELEEEEAQ